MKTIPQRGFRSVREAEAFSLVEVVLAIGVIAFAIVAILGLFPAGLSVQHSAQDDTRAAQIAGDILSSLASQARSNLSGNALADATIAQPSGFSKVIPLSANNTYTIGAGNDGILIDPYTADLPYKITITTNASPTGFDSGYACQVSVRVAWQPFTQNYRDFVRITTRY